LRKIHDSVMVAIGMNEFSRTALVAGVYCSPTGAR
jgi:hypothetical protein